MRNTTFILLMIVYFNGCNKQNVNFTLLFSALEKLNVNCKSDNCDILIITNNSCRQCSESLKKYIRNLQKIDSSEIFFVFTGFNTKKDVRLLYGMEINEPRVILDYSQYLYKFIKNSKIKFPARITFRNGKLIHITDFDQLEDLI